MLKGASVKPTLLKEKSVDELGCSCLGLELGFKLDFGSFLMIWACKNMSYSNP